MGYKMRTMICTTMMYEGIEYIVEATLDVYNEHYGADADGNRGINRKYTEVDNVKIFTGDAVIEVTKEIFPVLEDKINDWIENYDHSY